MPWAFHVSLRSQMLAVPLSSITCLSTFIYLWRKNFSPMNVTVTNCGRGRLNQEEDSVKVPQQDVDRSMSMNVADIQQIPTPFWYLDIGTIETPVWSTESTITPAFTTHQVFIGWWTEDECFVVARVLQIGQILNVFMVVEVKSLFLIVRLQARFRTVKTKFGSTNADQRALK